MRSKLLIIIILIINGSIVAYGQVSLKLTRERNHYQAGDNLYKYQVAYKDPGSLGRELEWDFTNLNVLDDNYLIKYFYPQKKDTTVICAMEHRTRYYYRQRNDSLWATGFENYTTKVDYTLPELKMKFPFSYRDTLYSKFEGEGIYCNMLNLGVKGYTLVTFDAEGMLKLPDIKGKAIRVHTKRYYTEVKANRNEYQILIDDPEDKAESDIIKEPQQNTDTVRMSLDTYSWYIKDVRYPVFESIKTTIHRLGQDTTVFYTSFYYTPEELPANYNLETPEIPEVEQVFTEATLYPNPVVSDLRIDYKLTRDAVICFSIHNNIGQPMSRTMQRKQSEGWNSETIYMGHLLKGTYTLYVHVDDMVMSRVVVKQ